MPSPHSYDGFNWEAVVMESIEILWTREFGSVTKNYEEGKGYVEVSRNANNSETERQKINYDANNDRNLTKLTTHCLDLYQDEAWQFFRPHLPPIMVITA